jgi:hypothetical protein
LCLNLKMMEKLPDLFTSADRSHDDGKIHVPTVIPVAIERRVQNAFLPKNPTNTVRKRILRSRPKDQLSM